MDWLKLASDRAATDETYAHYHCLALELEPDFLRLRSSLSEEDRNLLDQYLTACEEMDNALTRIAYALGREGC